MDRGRLVQIGTPREIYEDPANAYVAQRLGQPAINLLPAAVFEEIGFPAGSRDGRSPHGASRRRRVRAECRARITRVEHLGDQSHLHIDIDGHALTTLADPDAPFEAGDAVSLALRNPLLFDGQGERLRP